MVHMSNMDVYLNAMYLKNLSVSLVRVSLLNRPVEFKKCLS